LASIYADQERYELDISVLSKFVKLYLLVTSIDTLENDYRHELAENGFTWCVTNARRKMNENVQFDINR
jgi:hypothetical protein